MLFASFFVVVGITFKSWILAIGKIYILSSEEIGLSLLSNLFFVLYPERVTTALGSLEFTVRFASW